MKILVSTVCIPFVHGGAEELRNHLVRRLRDAGHQAESMSIPFAWDPAEQVIESMIAMRNLKITNVDRVIALKFPAYLIPHSNKVLWILHQHRQAYDLFDANQTNIAASARGEAMREMIRAADAKACVESRAVFTASPVSQKRLLHYNGIESTALPAPLNDPELFEDDGDENYIFAGGRVGGSKRQELLIRALPHAPQVRLVIAGPPDNSGEATRLVQVAGELGVSDRVVFDLQLLPREELARWMNRCRACAYIPFDEDSVGYVSMEAFQASKPVITTDDSGGVLRIVRPGETGYVAPPSPEGLGGAFRACMGNAPEAARFGKAGRALLDEWQLTWSHTIERLLA